MNFGYYDIQKIIYQNAIDAKYPGASKFAKDTAKRVWAMIEEKEGSMGKRDWNMAHGVSDDMESFIKRLEKALGGYVFKRDEKSLEVYQWVKSQPEEHLRRFIVWATNPERVQFIGKYRNNPGAIRFDWEQVKSKEPTYTKNGDGSLYV